MLIPPGNKTFNSTRVHLSLKKPRKVTGISDTFAALQCGDVLAFSGMFLSKIGPLLLPDFQCAL